MSALPPYQVPRPAASVSGPSGGHDKCRVGEFVRWNRIMLEHERAYLSGLMSASRFRPEAEANAIMHDLADIDWCLAHHPKRVETPDAEPEA